MKAEDLERSYQEMMSGRDEPDIMYVQGRTLKELLRNIGDTATRTSEGQAIEDGELYCMTRQGIFLVE